MVHRTLPTLRKLGWLLVLGWVMFWVGWSLHPRPSGSALSPTQAATRLEEVLPAPAPRGPGVPLNDAPAPDVRLVTATGRSFSMAQLVGRVVVLAFVDPAGGTETTLAARVVRDAWAQLGSAASRALALAVGVRPPPANTQAIEAAAPWVAVVGPPRALARLRVTYDVTVEPTGRSVAYTPAVVVLDRRGRAARLLILSRGIGAARQGNELARIVRQLGGSGSPK